MKAKIVDGVLHLEIPLEKPRPSASGKTRVIYSTGGFTGVKGVKYKDSDVKANITLTIPKKDE